jgi:hypothetical protein
MSLLGIATRAVEAIVHDLSEPRTVAILCAARKTAYRDIPGLEIYDEAMDARTFTGGMPVIAHPPCRYWLKHGLGTIARQHAKPQQIVDEKMLGMWCVLQVRKYGGIVEQPARSELWDRCGLPIPGSPQSPDSFSLAVWQSWWGCPVRKATWLYFRNISQFAVDIPFVLTPRQTKSQYRRYWQAGSGKSGKEIRSHTVPAFANWLVDLARTAVVTPC